MIRLGLCCSFIKEEIKFRFATARYVLSLTPAIRREYLGQIALNNSSALKQAIQWCASNGIGAFRINSAILPLYTHPNCGYKLEALNSAAEVIKTFKEAGALARSKNIRLSFHPDQFVVPGSPSAKVSHSSLDEIEYQAQVAGFVGAEQITLHGGGAYGDKPAALYRLVRALDRLSPNARKLIALENDDVTYNVADLLPVCRSAEIPLIYDVHHHRCLSDGISEADAISSCAETWKNREPWMHISSPANGWSGPDVRAHAELINSRDWPKEWLAMNVTVDIEAKAKELAVLKCRKWLLGKNYNVWGTLEKTVWKK